MIHIAFAFNFNIQRSAIEVGEEKVIIDRGYRPLLSLLLKHGIKADLFLSGYSTRTLLQMAPAVLGTIKENLGRSFELGTYTYTHPIPQLLEPQEMARQIRRGLEIDRELFGVNPAGFLPPELAYTYDMVKVLSGEGLDWVVVLASFLQKALPQAGDTELYTSYTALSREARMTVVPAAYQLPGLPARFFKLMMKGRLPVEEMVTGVKRFAAEHPGALLLFKRDAETIFIDAYNSGFTGTEQVFADFLAGLAALAEARFVTIGEFITGHPPVQEVALGDFLGNTKIETFTEGTAEPIWTLTQQVRERLFAAERRHPAEQALEKAWEHLLLSHNSDGRIGYWHSEWNPGEHTVAPSRRKFIEDNLGLAQKALDSLH